MTKKLMARKRIFAGIILSAMLVCCMPALAYAEPARVSLPTFTITLNGKKIDNATRKYPLIVYKDITYFPMTYHDSRFLGLETDWSQAGGLVIKKSDVSGGYYDDFVSGNSRSGTAAIPTFAITVNGTSINNQAEQYPLLTFRNVTYFPLTWRFAVDAFGWSYDFNEAGGLRIDSANRTSGADPREMENNGNSTNAITSMTVSLPLGSIQREMDTGAGVAGSKIPFAGRTQSVDKGNRRCGV